MSLFQHLLVCWKGVHDSGLYCESMRASLSSVCLHALAICIAHMARMRHAHHASVQPLVQKPSPFPRGLTENILLHPRSGRLCSQTGKQFQNIRPKEGCDPTTTSLVPFSYVLPSCKAMYTTVKTCRTSWSCGSSHPDTRTPLIAFMKRDGWVCACTES